MKKNMLLYAMMCTFFIFVGSVSLAAGWWGLPHYEWALSKNLTSMKTKAQLEQNVTLSDCYDIILKYLKLKNVSYKEEIVQDVITDGVYNGAIEGMLNEINSYIDSSQEKLTPTQYKNVETLVNHSKNMLSEYSSFLSRDDLKNIKLYMDLAKYRAAMLLSEDTKIEREYKNNVLYSLRNTKYASSLNYGILPMCGEMSRGTFFTLMYNLLSEQRVDIEQIDEEAIVEIFYESGVLNGYEKDRKSLKLNQSIKYSEMFRFLHQLENFDFGQNATEADEITEE